ncbi:GNAT family N-acetyltransferase [Promicromonospora kroppenstedtii]|uniref:GNAT family N-acetyltransferase n=1 Tax=Promicromonospora kroppenstedtii TaxID=440482 RepID=UPI0004B1E5D8|nr:hypothetical protein [Promicromonospora kroppenstedtii]
MSDWLIRPGAPEDFPAIRTVQVAAFGEDRFADGVDPIRESWIYRPALSLVAVYDGAVVGYAKLGGRQNVRWSATRVADHLTFCRPPG